MPAAFLTATDDVPNHNIRKGDAVQLIHRLGVAMTIISCVAICARAEEPSLRPTSTYEQPGKVMELFGVVRTPDSKQWLIGMVETMLMGTGSEAKWGIYRYLPEKGGVIEPLFVEQIDQYDTLGLAALAIARDGDLYVGGKFATGVSSIRKVSQTGKTVLERQYPNETECRTTTIMRIALTPREDVFVSGADDLCLYSNDLRLLWRVKSKDIAPEGALITSAVYDSKSDHFVATAVLGRLTKLGQPTGDARLKSIVVSFDYTGALVNKIDVAGEDPQLVVSDAGVHLLHSRGPQQKEQDYILVSLGPKLATGPEIILQSFPPRMLPMPHMLGVCICPDGRVVAATAEIKVAVRVWPPTGGAPMFSKDGAWPSLAGPAVVRTIGDRPFVIGTQIMRSPKPPITVRLRIDEVVLQSDAAQEKRP